MSLPACLVTSSPTFEDPERTPPFLIASNAEPDLREIGIVNIGGDPLTIEFSAGLRSEDNGQSIEGLLVRDYGVAAADKKPYREIDRAEIQPSTLDDTERRLAIEWFPDTDSAPMGCHTISLLATHKLDESTGCPLDPTDFDFLTWPIIVCDDLNNPCCDPTAGPGDPKACTNLKCPEVDPEVRCGVGQPSGLDSQAAHERGGVR